MFQVCDCLIKSNVVYPKQPRSETFETQAKRDISASKVEILKGVNSESDKYSFGLKLGITAQIMTLIQIVKTGIIVSQCMRCGTNLHRQTSYRLTSG